MSQAPLALIVEDDDSQRVALSALLTKLGFAIHAAPTLSAALKAISAATQLVVLDLLLPDGSGADVLQTVRRENWPAKVAVVSGAGNSEVYDRVTRLRPDAIFGKPLDVPDFIDWLKSSGFKLSSPPKKPSPPPAEPQAAGS